MTTCNWCGAPVRWELTTKGKRIPLDAEPSRSADAGNFVLSDRGAEYVSDDVRRQMAACGDPVYVAHFATCERKGN